MSAIIAGIEAGPNSVKITLSYDQARELAKIYQAAGYGETSIAILDGALQVAAQTADESIHARGTAEAENRQLSDRLATVADEISRAMSIINAERENEDSKVDADELYGHLQELRTYALRRATDR